MRVSNKLASIAAIGTLAGIGFAAAEPPDDQRSLAGKVFLVEATIVSSPIFPEYEGAVFPNCYTFEEDGTWIDLEWPGEGLDPIPGVWFQHAELPFVRFTTFARWPAAGWDLVVNGVATPGERRNDGQMTAYALVFTNTNDLVFYVTAKGQAVENCPL
jgi:hypothetical protein